MTLLIGVDVLTVERVDQLLDRFGTRVVERTATPGEASWIGMPASPQRLGCVLAVKEAAVKAIGGRPAGFSWRAVEIGPEPRLPAAVEELFASFAAGSGLAAAETLDCRLSGPALSLARRGLGGGPVDGAACWGHVDGHVYAAAALWESSRIGV